jgi:hypothetical protein
LLQVDGIDDENEDRIYGSNDDPGPYNGGKGDQGYKSGNTSTPGKNGVYQPTLQFNFKFYHSSCVY